MKKALVIAVVLTLMAGLVGGTLAYTLDSEQEALSVAELLDNPVYNAPVTIQGEVTLFGELLCPCFVLVSGGETIHVWYDLMVDDDGIEKPPVNIEGIENGDWVIITGELKQAGQHTALNDFWATSIEKGETQIVGGTPGSCGYVWDAEHGGWHRPWDPDSFIPAKDKPEWDKFIPSSSSLSVAELEETAIYAAVIQQLAIVDDTFGGNLNPKTLYVIKNTDDRAGNPVEGQQSDTRLITGPMQNEISSILNDLSIEIIWIDRFEDAEFEKSGFEVKRGGAIITLGNIYPRESDSVQVAGSIYIANLAAGGTTYILEEVDESWEITGRAAPTWMS
jgi:hypothetical protein